MSTPEIDRLISTAEVQDRLGISRGWLFEMLARRELPSVKIGRRRLVRASDLAEYIANLQG